MSSAERIRAAIKRGPVDLSPGSAYEAMTRARLEDLERAVAELRGRVDALVWAVIAAVVLGAIKMIGGF